MLTVLLIDVNHPVSADRLIERVWGERAPQRGHEALHSYLSRLRAILAPVPEVTLTRAASGYVLTIDEASVDLHRFRQLVQQARDTADAPTATHLFDDALRLWRDVAFADLDTAWLTSVRSALDAERRTAELDRTDAALRCGQHTALLADLTVQTAHHPLDERLAGQMMLALYRAGRAADALQHYQHLRRQLAEELGTDPNPSLQTLYQQILTTDPELAAPVPRTDGLRVTPRQLPPPPAWFTGRTGELATLDSALDSATTEGNTVLISALAGAGGIGKTWLALRWAHIHADRFPDGQLFVDLRGFGPSDPLDPLTAVRGFLDALGVDATHLTGGLAEHTARYRSHIAGKRMLILLDNAATADQVAPLLPGTPSCAVIVTSRMILTSLITRHGARHLNLDVLTDAEAQTLFVQRVGHARVAAEPDAVAELIRICGRYPLALSIVAGRAHAQPELPLAEFVTELRQSGLQALDAVDPTISLPTVLSWSLRGLTIQQRTVFALLGIAPGPDIGLPATVSLTGLPESQVLAVLRELGEASLVQRRPGGRYVMHDLIRAYAATTARHELDEQVREAALRQVLDFYTHTARTAEDLMYPNRRPAQPDTSSSGVYPQPLADAAAALAWFDTEHPALLAAQRSAARIAWHQPVWQLAVSLDSFHDRRGHRHDQLAAWQVALDAAAHLSEPASRMIAHRRLGLAYINLGCHDEAIEHLHQALTLAEEHDDPDQQARTHRGLALACERQRDDRQALAHATRTRDLCRSLNQPVVEADALNMMGWYAARLGDYDTARVHCQAALNLHRRHQHHTGVAPTLDSLGYIAHHSGDHQQAIGYYEQALAEFRLLGNTFDFTDTLSALGHPHTALGQREQARVLWREALELYREQGRDDDAARVQRQLDDLDKPDESP